MARRPPTVILGLGTMLLAACAGASSPSPTPAPTAAATATPAPEPSPSLPAAVDIEDAGALPIVANNDVDWVQVINGEAYVVGLGGGIGVLDASGKLTRSIDVTGPCEAMDVGFDELWSATCAPAGIARIDPSTGTVDARPFDDPIPESEASIGAGEGAVWIVVGNAADTLLGIDTLTLTVKYRYPIPPGGAGVRAGLGGVWVTRPGAGELLRVDPATGEVTPIEVGAGPRFLAVGEGGVWVMNQSDGSVSRVDPATNEVVATIDAWPIDGGDIAVGGGSVWLRGGPDLLARIDPATNTVTAQYGPQAGSGSVAADADAVWVTAHDVAKIWRLPLTP